jgi:coenzyme PQQ precursor peptide PqqA
MRRSQPGLARKTGLAAVESPPNENREVQIRMLAIGRSAARAETPGRKHGIESPASHRHRSTGAIVMKWETPQASDMRYGFEITMYIATR